MLTIDELAQSAAGAISDLMDEKEWEAFERLSSIEKIQYRYLHADCDDLALALHKITGWPIRSIFSEQGPLHRVVSDEDGTLIDVTGRTSLEEIKQRYGARRLTISDPNATDVYFFSALDDNEDFHEVVSTLLVLPFEPFTGEIRERICNFALAIGVESHAQKTSGFSMKKS